MTLPQIGANAELNLDRWTRNIQTMLRDAQAADMALQSIVDAANRAESALNSVIGMVDMKIAVDDSEIDAAVSLQDLLAQNTSFIASADDADIGTAVDLQAELDQNTAFVAGVDEAEIDAALRAQAGLDENTRFRAGVDESQIDAAKRKHDDLEQNTSFRAGVEDSEIDSARRKHADLGANVDTKVNVDDSEVDTLLRQIRDLQAVDIAINVAQPAVDFLKEVGKLSVGSLFEMDTAMAQLEGRTGRMIPGAEKLIRDLYVNAWGESRTEIAEVITLADQMGISQQDMAGAVEGAFQVAGLMGSDLNETLRTMDKLVKLGLVPSYGEAADVIIAGFQEGGNRADDLLETLDEYASSFSDLGMDAKQAINIVINGMEFGFKNTDLAADALREFNIRIRDMNDAAAQDAIKRLGLEDAAEGFRQGTLAGDEFLTLVITKLNEMEDPAQRQITAVEMFGTQLEDIGTNAIKGLDPTIDRLGEVSNRASEASSAFYDDIPTALTSLKRFAEEEIAGFLNEAFDIEGAIDDAKLGMQTFFNEMESGTGIFEALEVSFGIGGLERTMGQIQMIFAEVGIGILEALQSVLDFMGKGEAAAAIDSFIADIGDIQFGIEIDTRNSEEEISSSIFRAMNRGVNEADVLSALSDKFDAALESGDVIQAGLISNALNTALSDARMPIGHLFDTDANAVIDMQDALVLAVQSLSLEGANIPASQVDEFAASLFDVHTMQSRLTDSLSVAVEEAIGDGDIGRLLDLGALGGPQGSRAMQSATELTMIYQSMFRTAIDNLDLAGAYEALELFGGNALPGMSAQVDELATFLRDEYSSAVARQDFDLALDYAELLGEQDLIDTVETLTAEIGKLNDPRVLTATEALNTNIVGLFAVVDDTAQNISGSGEDIGETFETLSDSSKDTRKKVETEVQSMGKAINVEASNVGRSGRDMSKTFSDTDRASALMQKGASREFRTMSGEFGDAAAQMERDATDFAAALDAQMSLATSDMQDFASAVGKHTQTATADMQKFTVSVQRSADDLAGAYTEADGAIAVSLDSIVSNVEQFASESNTAFITLEKTTGMVLAGITDDFLDLSRSALRLGDDIGGAVQDAESEFIDFGVIWHNQSLTMGDQFSGFVDRIQVDTDRLLATLREAQRQAQNIDLTPRGGTGGGTGGTGGGGRGFLENDTALAAHGGDFVSSSSVSSSSSVTNIDVDYNFYTNSTAQDLAGVGSTASQLRGFN